MFNNHTAQSLYWILVTETSGMSVMKMGNIMPTVGLKPTSLAFWASVLQEHHIGSLISPLFQRLPVYATACSRGQCSLL